jgi:hypothetical protein
MRSFASPGMLALVISIGSSATASAQVRPDHPWSGEFGIGWDNSISGNINSSAVGTINDQTVVILKNRYEDVYGTGLHLRFGGGYMVDEETEVRVTFTFQSLDADLVRLGDIGPNRLYAQYDDYQSLGLDVGLRRYGYPDRIVRPYAEGTIGIAFIDKTNIQLIAPEANLILDVTDFYDKTAAFTLAGNVGVMWQVADQADIFAQIGLRFVTGMAEVDQLVGTGLDTINDNSSRWTMPTVFGVRMRF